MGGFGSNEYLKKRLQEEQPDIEVIQPNGAWSAIVKGAVLSCLPSEAAVTSSIATRHYGTAISSRYSSVEDLGEEKTWDECDGMYRCQKVRFHRRVASSDADL